MFETLTNRMGGVFTRLRGKGRLSDSDVDEALREVRLALLEADVNLNVTKALIARIRERAVGEEVHGSLTPGQQVIKIVNEELIGTLGSDAVELTRPKAPPLRILMVGLQGSGKTTSAAKLANRLKEDGKRPMLVAADLQRPAAIDQLEQLGRRIDVPVFVDRKGKPARLAKAALKEATKTGADVLIVDTAGRLQIDQDLMSELAAVSKAVDPDEVLLVVDAMTGQEAVNVATGFLERVELSGVVLSKLDGDARGGAAISVREVTGCPIKYAGIGEGIGDFEVFHPDRMAGRILGMGDVMTLIEKAEKTWDEQEAERAVEKMREATFDLDDFLAQFQQIKKMGSLSDLVGMIPGAPAALGNAEIDDRDMARVEAIIRSMTPEERQNPKIIKGGRRRRIAAGSGTNAQAVNRLLKQFGETQKMMQDLASGTGTQAMLARAGMRQTKKKTSPKKGSPKRARRKR
ncbi:MAG: signal recognition particle protein [Acidimicrobiia bacterium]|nr:signal recognition particle protein [Acidimicrobiia bacterium]MBT8193962.1 signal recognition particle protein [Acidimicrobiia bacterium]MBT8246560.1 signal recognition particle protein [Acidimicrobiia bacterium]